MTDIEKKAKYRDYFKSIDDYITWKAVCRNLNINYSNFRNFVYLEKNRYLSIEKCSNIVDFLTNHFDSVSKSMLAEGEVDE